MWFALKMMLRLLRLCGRARQDLILENLVLRHQLAVLERPGRRPALRDADRRLWSLIAHEWSSRRGTKCKCRAGFTKSMGTPSGTTKLGSPPVYRIGNRNDLVFVSHRLLALAES